MFLYTFVGQQSNCVDIKKKVKGSPFQFLPKFLLLSLKYPFISNV